MKPASSSSRAFTLIELMLVVAILGVALAMGYPSIARALHRAPLSQGVWDVMEGCRKARALAILRGSPMELRIFADHLEVAPSPLDAEPGPAVPSPAIGPVLDIERPKSVEGFSAQFSDRVAISDLKVNLMEISASDSAARVRFYPNGTCDEFTIELFCDAEKRRITMESVTALAGMERVQ